MEKLVIFPLFFPVSSLVCVNTINTHSVSKEDLTFFLKIISLGFKKKKFSWNN